MNLKINIFRVENKYLSLDRNRCWRLELKPKNQNFHFLIIWWVDILSKWHFFSKNSRARSMLVTYVENDINAMLMTISKSWWTILSPTSYFVKNPWKLSPILSRQNQFSRIQTQVQVFLMEKLNHILPWLNLNMKTSLEPNLSSIINPNLSPTSFQILFYLI